MNAIENLKQEVTDTLNKMDNRDLKAMLILLRSLHLGLIEVPKSGAINENGEAVVIRKWDKRQITLEEWLAEVGETETANARGFEEDAGDA